MAKAQNPIQGARPGESFTGSTSIAPSDTVPLSFATRALYVGAAGNVSVCMYDDVKANGAAGTITVFNGVPAGTTLNICVGFVMHTGTTATNMVGLH